VTTRRPGSLRGRLAGVLALTVALVVLVMAGVTFLLVDVQLKRGQDTALLREATRIQRLVETGSDFLASGSNACEYASEPACTRVVTATTPLESGDAALRMTSAARDVAAGKQASAFSTVDAPGRRVRVVVVPLRSDRAVMVGLPTTTTDRTIQRTGLALLVLGGAGILLSGLIGYLVARAGLRPVRLLAESIDRVAATRDPHDGVDTDRDDELGRLARSFTAMLAELAEADAAQQQLVADASHELRTPLTTLRTNIALLDRDDLPDGVRPRLREAIDHELREMQSLVGDLVELARGVEPVAEVVDVDLAELVAEGVPVAARHWPEVEYRVVAAAVARPALVAGDPERLARLVSVLLDNAGKYSVGTGSELAAVDVIVSSSGGRVTLEVADRGVGIPAEDLPRVFDRFFRSPSARSLPGSGLGLAIAHQIVVSFGGDIQAFARDGGGTSVVVSFPAAATAADDAAGKNAPAA
jgi:two-component system, OmpR family, sensor histidine kinase MprB